MKLLRDLPATWVGGCLGPREGKAGTRKTPRRECANGTRFIKSLIDQCTAEEREAVLAACWVVAAGDGRLARRERYLLQKIQRRLSIPEPVAARVEQRIRAGERRATVPASEAARRLLFHCGLRIVASDGAIAPRERRLAEQLGSILGQSQHDVAAELNRLLVIQGSADPLPETQDFDEVLALLHGERSAAGRRSLGRKPVAIGLMVLIAANLLPLGGVVYFGWGTFAVVFLYWLENVVISVFNIARIRGEMSQKAYDRAGLSIFGLFTFILGFFTLVQGIFVVGMLGPLFQHPELAKVEAGGFSFEPPPGAVTEALADVMSFSLVISILALVSEHAYAFRQDVKSRHHLLTPPALLIGRVIPLQVAIIGGAIWMVVHEVPHAMVIVLVALKIIVDAAGYVWEHWLSRARAEQGML